jgi:hypothetical protein
MKITKLNLAELLATVPSVVLNAPVVHVDYERFNFPIMTRQLPCGCQFEGLLCPRITRTCNEHTFRLCDFCGKEYPLSEAQCCAGCGEDMCEACLETHACIAE